MTCRRNQTPEWRCACRKPTAECFPEHRGRGKSNCHVALSDEASEDVHPGGRGGVVWSRGGKEAGPRDSRFIQSLDAVLGLGYELQPRASPQEGLR